MSVRTLTSTNVHDFNILQSTELDYSKESKLYSGKSKL